MSSPKHDRDSDRESLTDWTLVDREGDADKTTQDATGKDDDKDKDSGESKSSPASKESKKEKKEKDDDKEKKESGGVTEEEEGEELSEDLISMGKRVQEIKGESVKASSGSDSSDIETLDCPSPDDCYEDSTQSYSSLHSSLLSSLGGFTFVEEADEADIESLGSSDVMVLDQEEKAVDEETDLSLASSPSLPEDLPAIKPDTQYRHTPQRDLNSRLNVVVALTLACVLGLGLGHFLGWSSRSMWQENLNSAQVRRLRELQDDLLSCINSPPEVEPESGGPEYLPAATFIPVLAEAEAENTPNVETFVESLVVPLEEAGVVLDPGQQQHHHHQGEIHHTYHRHVHTDSMEPTFATLDLLYGSSDPAPAIPQEQEARIHSGLPELSSATTAPEDEIVYPLPQPVLPTKTVDPTIDEETAPTASPSNTLPPIETNPEHESIPKEEQEQQPIVQFDEVSEEEDPPPVTIENSQIIDALSVENEELSTEITRLQHENLSPIKISGKDGKNARNLRERITRLLEDNEELRVAVLRQQFDSLPEGDTKAFNDALGTNFKLRVSVGKLMHLVPDLTALKESANDLQKENQELQKQVGKLRYQEQPLPQELNVVAREVENLKKVVDEASKKKKVPPNYENAKMYLTYMSQVLQTLHDFHEGGLVEKLDVATDVFEGLVPGNVKPSASIQQKLHSVRGKFRQLTASLGSKWEKIKELSRPQHLTQVSQDTLAKMNRVIVNVVNKMKDIGQASIMKRGKASLESTAATLAQSLAALGEQFDKTWKNLESEVEAEEKGNSDQLLIEVEDEVQTEEEETAVEDSEGGAKDRAPRDAKDEASKSSTNVPNKSKKVAGKSGGSGGGGKGGGGGGRGGGRDGGDDKTDPEEKESTKEKAVKKKEEKPDARRDRSRKSRKNEKEEKKEKKEEQKEKKTKEKEEKAKKKKDKENKKSKKEKDESNKSKKSKDKEGSSQKKDEGQSRKSLQQEDKRYYKGQYNKYDKKHQQHLDDDDDDTDDEKSDYEGKLTRKLHTKKHIPDDEDDDDDDDDDDKYKRKQQQKVIQKDNKYTEDDDDEDDDDDDKKKGLLRHWEKPSRKNYRREYPGPKKAFIRRRGKNATVNIRDEDGEWMGKRATGREVRRKEEKKADWVFERAKHRSHKREEEHKAEWQFERARDRKEKRIGGGAEDQRDGKQGPYEKSGHTKHEGYQAKRRYVRFDDDDDDDFGEKDYEFYHQHHHHHHHHHEERGRREHKHHDNKGKREWVIPNFSATGKTFYH